MDYAARIKKFKDLMSDSLGPEVSAEAKGRGGGEKEEEEKEGEEDGRDRAERARHYKTRHARSTINAAVWKHLYENEVKLQADEDKESEAEYKRKLQELNDFREDLQIKEDTLRQMKLDGGSL